MGINERKDRQRTDREHRIVAAARMVAERDGWSAVTIRRLADEIEYSQPVLYSHFENRDAIVSAVAIGGFQELAFAMQKAARRSAGRESVENVAQAYLAFALTKPALYEAMFVLPTNLKFADADTRPEMYAAFEAIAAVIKPFCTDAEAVTETFWSALHGLAELERSHRIRPGARDERIALVVQAITGRATLSGGGA